MLQIKKRNGDKHEKIVFFTHEIKLVNEGYNNKIIDTTNNEVMDEITDTLQGAVRFVIEKYGASLK